MVNFEILKGVLRYQHKIFIIFNLKFPLYQIWTFEVAQIWISCPNRLKLQMDNAVKFVEHSPSCKNAEIFFNDISSSFKFYKISAECSVRIFRRPSLDECFHLIPDIWQMAWQWDLLHHEFSSPDFTWKTSSSYEFVRYFGDGCGIS